MYVCFQTLNSVLSVGTSVLISLSHCAGYCSFRVGHNIRSHESPNYVLLFQNYFGYFRTFAFSHVSLGISLSILQRVLLRQHLIGRPFLLKIICQQYRIFQSTNMVYLLFIQVSFNFSLFCRFQHTILVHILLNQP